MPAFTPSSAHSKRDMLVRNIPVIVNVNRE